MEMIDVMERQTREELISRSMNMYLTHIRALYSCKYIASYLLCKLLSDEILNDITYSRNGHKDIIIIITIIASM